METRLEDKRNMRRQEITQGWTLQVQGEKERIPAQVPGSVYYDLLRMGRMEDPFWRDNEDEALKWMEKDFVYETRFTPESGLFDTDEIRLCFDGLDTIADIYLNGCLLGRADNMHRAWAYSVTGMLLRGENILRIYFHSPVKYIRERYAECVTMGSEHCMDGFPQIRKAHCMFGWDWGPRLPDAGIWKNVFLQGVEKGRLESVYVTQEHEEQKVTLYIRTEIASAGETQEDRAKAQELSYRVTVTDPQGNVRTEEDSPECLVITQPLLWWPNGYGEQNLYGICVQLMDGSREVDRWEKRIGLRTMTVHREKDVYGESFAHEVNGVQIFAMGADYIPEDNIFGRITGERTRKLLEQCRAANYNCIRVWGGGFYPHDDFYDACDELGLVVWQDLMFACAVYELTEDFDKNIRAEIRDNVRRLRHHASLGLWCGNNEMEMFVDEGQWVNTLKQKADYVKMYEYIIPQVLKEEDPQTFYWPASPSSGGSFDAPNDPDRGDVHYWEVWHGDKPFSEYRKYYFRYASEFGFQSFPCLKTVEAFTLPEDRNIFSYVMDKHQRNDAANGKIMKYLYQTFLYPTDFDTLLYASQLLQGEAIKYGVEHFRRNRGRCMGAVYWQLNDCWPVASWSSIDYYGRWKALHYYAKRFFAPILLSCREEGMMTQNTNVNAQPFQMEKSVTFNVSNETPEDKVVRVVWAVRDRFGGILQKEETELSVPTLSSVWMEKRELPDMKIREEYISYDLFEDDRWVSGSTVILTLPRFFRYEDPQLTVESGDGEVIVRAKAYAKSVEIRNRNENLVLEDNYFDMNAGERRVKVVCGEIKDLTVRSVFDIR